MSQRNRLGLTDLAGLRKPLVQAAPAAVPLEEPPAVHDAVPSHTPARTPSAVPVAGPTQVPSAVPPRILQERKEKRRLVSQSFKLPADLDERWSNIAAFNQVTKTGILIEALETFLERLPQPPENK